MSTNSAKPDMEKDERERAIKTNPCGICRAKRLPVCRCRGGGGSGGGGGSDSSNDLKDDASRAGSAPYHLELSPVPALIEYLNESQVWFLEEDADLIFKFENPLLKITLDMENGSLVLQGKKDLKEDEQNDLDALFDAIEDELNNFKMELKAKNIEIGPITMVRDHNTLSIKIPNPQYFDLFITRLMNKNLLPHHPDAALQLRDKNVGPSALVQAVLSNEENKPTAPTPFDIRPRPKPKD
ncbi:Uncharacterised protein [Legionella lansingensis]|uniref:Uncharacterized protein n=1 Tax=Legionella lansingensis TaxID=45067 RepID=A0A0W0VL64_9GAMM|nr:hypothetical protein [Legionella lansingensis]KTD20808.1 hypothetical protein Llan_1765 [Legionella lansingensis]SNV49841.1 Uncharacterised protein [Legionella lansingensis]